MDSRGATTPDPGCLRDLGARLRSQWLVKFVGTSLGMTFFFVAYFWLLHHPHFPVTTMPVTAVDRLIGFRPEALPLYFSLWFYISLAPALLRSHRELASYAVAATTLSVVGLALFFFWPTAVPAADVNWSRYPGFGFLKSADAAGNACPSLHVAFAVFSACWFERVLREMHAGALLRGLNWAWCVGIAYSTVATLQHVFLDAAAGAALGAIVAAAHFRWLRWDAKRRTQLRNCSAVGMTQR